MLLLCFLLLLLKLPNADEPVVSGVFVGCQFEMDSCEWKDVSVGQFSWQRGQNGTTLDNTGPSVDHTTGTELGMSLQYPSFSTKMTFGVL